MLRFIFTLCFTIITFSDLNDFHKTSVYASNGRWRQFFGKCAKWYLLLICGIQLLELLHIIQ